MVSIVRRELTTSSSSMISAHCSSKGGNQTIHMRVVTNLCCSFIRNVAVHHVAEYTELGYHGSWGDSLSSKGCEKHDRSCEKSLQHNPQKLRSAERHPTLDLVLSIGLSHWQSEHIGKVPSTQRVYPVLVSWSLCTFTGLHNADTRAPYWFITSVMAPAKNKTSSQL